MIGGQWREAVTTKVLRLDSCIRFNIIIFNHMAQGGKTEIFKVLNKHNNRTEGDGKRNSTENNHDIIN